jgi:transposase, IS5 family
MLERIAKDSGIKTPTREDWPAWIASARAKKLSNKDWKSESDEDARITKMKDAALTSPTSPNTPWTWTPERLFRRHPQGRPGGHDDDRQDAESARKNLSDIGCTPITTAPTEVIADKGYHSREVVKELDGGVWKTRIAEPKANGSVQLER